MFAAGDGGERAATREEEEARLDPAPALSELLGSLLSAVGARGAWIVEEGSVIASAGEAPAEGMDGKGEHEVPVSHGGREVAKLYAAGELAMPSALSAFAPAVGYILANARELQEARMAFEEARVFQELGVHLSGPAALDQLLTSLVGALRKLTSGDYAAAVTISPDGKLHWRAVDGFRSTAHKEPSARQPHGTVGRAIREGRPVLLEGIGVDPDLPAEEFPITLAEGGVSILAIPMFVDGRPVGTLMLGSRTMRRWRPAEISAVGVLANAAALAIALDASSRAEKTQRAFLSQVLESFPGVLAVFDSSEMRVLLHNRGFSEILARPFQPEGAAVNRSLRELNPRWGKRTDQIVAHLTRVIETGEPVTFERWSMASKGNETYWNWSAVPVEGVGVEGQRAVMLIASDVTESVRASDSARARAEELDAIISQMADGVTIYSADGKAARLNAAGQRIIGRKLSHDADASAYAQVYGLTRLDGTPYEPEELPYRRALRGELVLNEQMLVRRPDGDEAIISLSSSPITARDGAITGAVSVFHDITHEKMTERMKDEFLAVVSHELRTPLSAIMGYSDLLRRGVHGPLAERQVRALNAVRSNADRLLRLINDLLDVSKLESGATPVDIAPVRLPELVSRTLAQTKVLAVNAGVRLEQKFDSALPAVLADGPKLQQVFENLLSNALKFTPAGGEVEFTARASKLDARDAALTREDLEDEPGEGEARSVVVSVTDTGAGLTDDEIERIWDRFYQADTTARRRSGGAGLGLSIVRSLIELQGGQVWARSGGRGRGSTFNFSLGVAQDAPEPPAVEAPARPAVIEGSGVGVVLVAEDDDDQREIICDMLELEGYDVVVASDGEEALEAARLLQPAAIALDVILPRTDGWDVLQKLKADERTRDIPVLIISVVDQQEFGRKLGADEYLIKPLEPAALRNAVRRLIEDREKSDAGQDE